MEAIKNNQLKFKTVWYLDGNYNKPVKTIGVETSIQTDRYYKEAVGYLFVNPQTKALIMARNDRTVFDTKKDAEAELERQIKSHIDYLKKSIKNETASLLSYGAVL